MRASGASGDGTLRLYIYLRRVRHVYIPHRWRQDGSEDDHRIISLWRALEREEKSSVKVPLTYTLCE